MNAIHAKITVERQNRRAGTLFDHTHQTGVGERHRHVGVACHQSCECSRLPLDAVSDLDDTSSEQLENCRSATRETPQQEARLRHDWLARQDGWLNVVPL